MTSSRSGLLRIAIPFLLAAAIEALTWRFFPVAVDLGTPPGTPWYRALYESCSVWLHAPAILLADAIHGHNALIWLLSGWFTTSCCLLLLTGLIALPLKQKRPAHLAGGPHP